jgi:hypothetical protein
MSLHDAGGRQRLDTFRSDPVFAQHFLRMFAEQRRRAIARARPERSPSVFSDSSLSPSFLRTTAARKARTVCGCQPVERVTVAMVAPLGPHSSASTRACFEFARPLGRPLPAAFERILDADRALMVRAGLRLDMQNSSQERRRNSAPEG